MSFSAFGGNKALIHARAHTQHPQEQMQISGCEFVDQPIVGVSAAGNYVGVMWPGRYEVEHFDIFPLTGRRIVSLKPRIPPLALRRRECILKHLRHILKSVTCSALANKCLPHHPPAHPQMYAHLGNCF